MEFNNIKLYEKFHENTHLKQEMYHNNEKINVNYYSICIDQYKKLHHDYDA